MTSSGIDTWTPDVLPGGTILIVDQEANVRASVGTYLRELGFQTRYASDRSAADSMLAVESVDLVLADLRIATGGRPNLLCNVRERSPDLPVVVMTAQRYVNDAIECIRGGASDYLTKPINLRYLGRCIAGLVAERRSGQTRGIGFDDPFSQVESPAKETRIGDYELSGIIGSGSMGTVYHARRRDDGINGTSYALKLLNLNDETDYGKECAIRQFTNEAETSSLIRHDSVVHVVEHGIASGGRPYLVMEYLHGQTLRTWIDAEAENADVYLKASILRQATEALDAIHEHGIVHRDIKPDNMILSENLHLKVTDFGIATSHSLPECGNRELGGSPAYVAPEIFHGLPYDHRADLFSLGIVGYELFTGHRPFVADTLDEYANVIANHCPPHPDAFTPGVPPALISIIGRLLEKEPSDRYQAAARVTRDLDTVLSGQYGSGNPAALKALCNRKLTYNWSRSQNRRLVAWERTI